MSTISDEARIDLCRRIVQEACAKHMTIGTAESCTGGLVCAALTDIPGSSSVVKGGVVSYAVPVKEDVLGVPSRITQDPDVGVVSSQCAAYMCEGARRVLDCDVAVSVTGIAGPGGAEPGKPVGTVWFGICDDGPARTEVVRFDGDRASVRKQATYYALTLIEKALGAW